MQSLARISVQRPVFAAVLVLALSVIGLFAIPRLGVDRFPSVDFPFVTVTTVLNGATPEEMETEVTEEIEKQVNTVAGIEQLTSWSSEGVSVVQAQFVLEKDPDIASQEISSKVDLALPNLPAEAEKPVIQKFDSASGATLQFTLAADNATIRDLTEYADKRLRPQLESINGVGQIQIIGGRKREIWVEVDPYRLRSYNLTVADVKKTLQTQNLQVPGGSLDAGANKMAVRAQGRVESVSAIEELIVATKAGHSILLRDVARISDAEEEPTTAANVSGVSAVLLSVRKQSGSNTVKVIELVKERLHQIEPTLPQGYHTRIVSDQSVFIEAALHAVQEHLILGAILASLVVLVFLRNWRSTLIAAIAIPTSIVSTFTLMAAMGFTLNIITLLALTLAVGIVIDDAIIVIENIWKHLEESDLTPMEAAIHATKEIGLAVLATTLSLVAVFLPVAFMTGIVGRFLNSFGLTMAFAIIVSMFVAFTLTPMLSSRWLKKPETKVHGEGEDKATKKPDMLERVFRGMEAGYARLMRWSLRFRWVVVVASVLSLLAMGPLMSIVGKNFMPEEDESQFLVSVRAPEGTSVDGTEKIMNRIATDIRKLPEIDFTVITIGDDAQQTQNLGTIMVQMKEIKERKTKVSQYATMQRVRQEVIARYPRELRTIVSPPSAFGRGAEAAIQYNLSGPDLATLNKAATAVVAELRKTPGVADANTTNIPPKPELSAKVDRRLAADLGVSVADVAGTMRALVAGEKVSDYTEDGKQYDIRLRALPEYRDQERSLALFTVATSKKDGDAIPLNQVAHFEETSSPSMVKRYGRSRSVGIEVNMLPGGSQQTVQEKLTALIKAQNLGPQYRGEFYGQSREMGRTFSAFAMAFGLSFIIMYLVLAAQFESWLHPLTILSSLPLTVPFALLSLVLLGESLNIYSMLGLLVLFGVVKKNAILQVDHANQLRESGMERNDAIVQASQDRLRPILMTTIAFVAGMLPLMFSSEAGAATNRATGGIIIGGQTLSLLLTLVAIPVFYSLMDDLTVAIGKARVGIAGMLTRKGEKKVESGVPTQQEI